MLVLALVLAMTVLFCSCEQKPIDPPETTPAETTEEPLPETFDVVKDGKITLTRIVRSADITSSDAPEITAAKKLRDTINNLVKKDFGVELNYDETVVLEEDFLMPMTHRHLRSSSAVPHMRRARAHMTDSDTAITHSA